MLLQSLKCISFYINTNSIHLLAISRIAHIRNLVLTTLTRLPFSLSLKLQRTELSEYTVTTIYNLEQQLKQLLHSSTLSTVSITARGTITWTISHLRD